MLLYHLAPSVTTEQLRAAGYGWLTEPGLVRCQTAAGPADKPGTVLADAAQVPADRCRYQAEGQAWLPTAVDGLHAGLWTDLPAPGPEDLAHAEQLAGHLVELVDGARWLVPIARGWTEQDGELRWYHTLPRRLTRGADGWQPGDVLPRFARLWEIAQQWEARWAAGFAAAVARAAGDDADADEATGEFLRVDLSLTDAADLAAEVLAVNYRLGAAEISLLGLFADATPAAVLDALIDRPTRIAWAKKNAPPAKDTPNSPDGAPGSTAATDRP